MDTPLALRTRMVGWQGSATGLYWPSKKVKDLGVHLSPDLRWATQVSEAVQSANKMANWVISVFTDRSKVVMLTLFKTMVRIRLEYSCPVWNPSLMADIKKLESSQRAFTRHISGCYGLSYWQRLKFLDLMSLQRRGERYAIIHVWKIIKGLAPNDINIKSYEHIRLGVRCRVPPLPSRAAYAKSIYDSSFAVTGPKLWNILPRSVTCAPSLESFKSRLTSHIMGSYPDQPPVPGYTLYITQLKLATGLEHRWSTTDGLAWISGKNLQEVTRG